MLGLFPLHVKPNWGLAYRGTCQSLPAGNMSNNNAKLQGYAAIYPHSNLEAGTAAVILQMRQ